MNFFLESAVSTKSEVLNKELEISQHLARKIGMELKTARKEKKLSISTIETDLKISRQQIQNFESGYFQNLPEAIYALGFLKSYSDYLDANTDEIIEEFKTVLNAKVKIDDRPIGFKRIPETKKKSLLYTFIIATILYFLLYIGWNNYSHTGRIISAQQENIEIKKIT